MLTEDALLTADAGTFEIFAITFDAHSELDRKRLAVREITESKVQDNGMPQDDGVMSYYLGSNNAAHLCKTCHNTGGVAGQCASCSYVHIHGSQGTVDKCTDLLHKRGSVPDWCACM